MDAVAAMDSESVGVYLWLCTRQWQSGPLPSDEDALKRILRGRISKWSKVWPQVRAGFEEIDGRLVAAWIEVERAVADAFLAKQKANGSLGGRPRKPKRNPRVSHGKPMANPNLTQPNPTQSHRPDRTVQNRDQTEEKTKTPLPPEGEAAAPPALPREIDTPELRAALAAYQASRKEQGHKPLKQQGLTALYGKLAAWGHTAAVAALQQATANGWQGVFYPKDLHPDGRARFASEQSQLNIQAAAHALDLRDAALANRPKELTDGARPIVKGRRDPKTGWLIPEQGHEQRNGHAVLERGGAGAALRAVESG